MTYMGVIRKSCYQTRPILLFILVINQNFFLLKVTISDYME